MQDQSFDTVASHLIKAFGSEATHQMFREYHIYDRDYLFNHQVHQGDRFAWSFSADTDIPTVRRYLDMMDDLKEHPDTRYWNYDDTITVRPVTMERALAVLKRLILSVNVQYPVHVDDDQDVRPRVHKLMDAHRTAQALDELYCQYGDMVDRELVDMNVQDRTDALYQLQFNLNDAVNDWDVDEDSTDELKDIIQDIDQIERSDDRYWSLGVDDAEEPRPLDYESMDLLIYNVIDFSAED